MIRRLLILTLALSVSLSLAACGDNTEEKSSESKTVYLLSWGGTIQTMLEKDGWAKRFKEDTGYTVRLVPKATSSEIMAAAALQKSDPKVDLVMADFAAWIRGIDQDLFAKIDESSVPNLKHVYDTARIERDGALYGVFPYIDIVGVMYNKEEFEKNNWEPFKTWDDLLRPELAGTIIMPPPDNTYGMYALIQFAKMNGGSQTEIDPGFEFYKRLAPSIFSTSTTFAQIGTLIDRGEAAVAVFGNGSAAELNNRDIPVEFVLPDPAYMSPTAMGIVKNGPNPQGAEVFLNWWLSPEVLGERASTYFQTPMIDNVEIETEALESLILDLSEIEQLESIDYEAAAEARSNWVKRYQKEIAPLIREN